MNKRQGNKPLSFFCFKEYLPHESQWDKSDQGWRATAPGNDSDFIAEAPKIGRPR